VKKIFLKKIKFPVDN